MRFWGIQKVTYLDYPWKIATILFTVGCGFRCRFCYNKQFVLPEEIQKDAENNIPEAEILQYLENRKWLLDAVVMCWWEPALQPDLAVFLQKVKAMWYLVKLDTNGRHPEIIQSLIDDKLVDYIAMDIKDDFVWMDRLTQTKDKQASLQQSIDILIKNSATHGIDYEFRTTVIKPYHTSEKIEAIASYIADRAKEIAKELEESKKIQELVRPIVDETPQKGQTLLSIKQPKYAIQNFYPTDNMIDSSFEAGKFTGKEMQQLQEAANKYIQTEVRGVIHE